MIDEQTRDNGRIALSTKIRNVNNLHVVEKYIFNTSTTAENYTSLVYEIINIVDTCNKDELLNIIRNIKTKKVRWQNPVFKKFSEKIYEQEQFLMKPFEIEEGVIECKCGSKRTISFQRQMRSADEGSTTFSECVECGHKWKHNN